MDKKVYSQEEMEMWIKHLIKQLPPHINGEPSQKTLDGLTELRVKIDDIPKNLGCKAHSNRLEKLENAIYGDRDDDESFGMRAQMRLMSKQLTEMQSVVNEMYIFFNGTKGTSKLIVYVFSGISVISAGIFALMKAFK